MKQTTEQSVQAAAAAWFNDAAQAAADYSSKVAARQLAFARKIAERGENFAPQTPPDAAETKRAASDYLIFARESAEDFAQAVDRNFTLLDRAMEGAAAGGRAFLPPSAEAFGRRWLDGVKAANAAIKDGVRISCRAAVEGLRPAEIDGATAAAAPAKSAEGKGGKK